MARDFESGSSQYLECATTPITAVDLTISAWIKPETAIASYICGIFDNAGDVNWHALRVGGAGPGIQAASNATTEATAVTSTNVAAGVWQHVCATFGPTAGTDRIAYLNGAGKGTNTTNKVPAGLDRVGIGVRSSLTRTGYFDGLIAEVTLWNAQLTDSEVLSLANRVHPLTVRSPNVVAYWPLYGVGSPEPNLGTSSLNMTVTGATLSEEHAPIAPFPPAERIWLPSGVSAGPTTHNGAAALSGAGALAAAGAVPTEVFGSTGVLSSVVADNFNDNSIDMGIWQTPYTDPGCTVTETGQRLEISMASGDFYGALATDYQGPLVGMQQIARLVQHHGSGYTGGNSYVNVQSGVGPWTGYSLEVGADVMRFLEYDDDTSAREMAVLATPALPVWLRLTVTGAVVTLETSPDGSVWTQVHAEPTLAGASAITDAYGELGAHTTPGESGVTVWDDYVRSSLVSGLVGGGALAASGGRVLAGTAALSGSGALTAVVVRSAFAAAALAGAGSLAAVGLRTCLGAALLSGSGSFSGSGVVLGTITAAAVLSGSGTLVSGGAVGLVGAALLQGSGAALASGYPIVFSRPEEVMSAGGWSPSTGTLWGCVDEVVASDADFIYSSSTLSIADTCELGLAAVDDPTVGYGHAVSYRFRKDVLGGSTVQLTVSLVQGTTVIASWVHSDVEAVSTVRQELSPAEANSISDYGDLRLRFEAVEA